MTSLNFFDWQLKFIQKSKNYFHGVFLKMFEKHFNMSIFNLLSISSHFFSVAKIQQC